MHPNPPSPLPPTHQYSTTISSLSEELSSARARCSALESASTVREEVYSSERATREYELQGALTRLASTQQKCDELTQLLSKVLEERTVHEASNKASIETLRSSLAAQAELLLSAQSQASLSTAAVAALETKRTSLELEREALEKERAALQTALAAAGREKEVSEALHKEAISNAVAAAVAQYKREREKGGANSRSASPQQPGSAAQRRLQLLEEVVAAHETETRAFAMEKATLKAQNVEEKMRGKKALEAALSAAREKWGAELAVAVEAARSEALSQGGGYTISSSSVFKIV